MTKPLDFIDRELEIELFEAILDRSRWERILTLLIRPERGKTYLMNYLLGHCYEKQIPAALVDFDKRQKGGIYYWKFAQDVCDQLGPQNFPDVHDCMSRHQAIILPLIQIQTGAGDAGMGFGSKGRFEDATFDRLSGRDQVDVKVGDITYHEAHSPAAVRQERLMDELGRAFRANLNKICTQKRVVLLLDTYEQAFLETRQWVDEWLFSSLTKYYPNLIVVLAGRPELHDYLNQPKTWQNLMFLREELSTPPEEEVRRYVKMWNLPVTGEKIEPFMVAAQYNMATLARLRDAYRRMSPNV